MLLVAPYVGVFRLCSLQLRSTLVKLLCQRALNLLQRTLFHFQTFLSQQHLRSLVASQGVTEQPRSSEDRLR